jgi:hypothetical protein
MWAADIGPLRDSPLIALTFVQASSNVRHACAIDSG